ncbi:hypothetical protein [Streptomyces sp.]|uniref:hypothetical protein n=1 Tax=Streptomyces sp. TaxID=1931 RepID=UPI002F428BFD
MTRGDSRQLSPHRARTGGRLEAGYVLAGQAVEAGLRYRSGRVVDRARIFRRSYSSSTPPKTVRDFAEKLHGVYL